MINKINSIKEVKKRVNNEINIISTNNLQKKKKHPFITSAKKNKSLVPAIEECLKIIQERGYRYYSSSDDSDDDDDEDEEEEEREEEDDLSDRSVLFFFI